MAHHSSALPAFPSGRLHPALSATLVAHPPAGRGWLHEMKHDGYRMLASKEADRVTLMVPYGTDFTDKLPRIAEAVRALPADNALIDGEAVVFRPDGHSDFAALRTRAGGEQAALVAFDLLSLEGDDLRQRPLEERREALSRLVAGVDGIRFSAASRRRRDRVRSCLRAWPGRDRVEAGRQPLSQRAEPQVAEEPEPGLPTLCSMQDGIRKRQPVLSPSSSLSGPL